MSAQQIMGIILLVVGVILLFAGWQASQSVGEQLHETMMGRFTDSTMWYLIGGIGAAVGGVLLLVVRR
ncbi:drug/metabolite transporter (DMT)-like permease [Natronocella acetinitrilica]|jgi:drug/metabolite transporter (DMT)-like permease|uniref:Drug/metabolite transporter (DMT)-like permease n=1 Tax=Natronocella acetinitrilica TaxID=414046 RepID=A0AAE3G7Y4_9GAMM|nr:DUF3185 family protein [Natronocella acetinitrilica]MCP1677117.1 drug/metabolite transporter (DMT)-like permease [Natronocella acetinitrilica]